MLDDITIAARMDGINNVPSGMLPLNTVVGRPETFGVASDGGPLYVTFCPATKIVSVRISVPRWMHKNPVNFPLVPVRSVEDIHPDRISLLVAHALGFRVSAIGDDAARLIPIRRWAVIRVSFAADLRVLDPLRSIHGSMGIHRKNPGTFTCFGKPAISTSQWSSKSLRVKFYAKGLEVQTHKAHDDTERAILERLAGQADHILRFEVTFTQVRSLRRLFRLGQHLPTLGLMCDPRIDRWVLTREAQRLRLDESYESLGRESFPIRARHVTAVLREAQQQMASGELSIGRRRTLTQERMCDLALCHFLASGGLTAIQVAEFFDCSRSGVAEMLADLRELAIPPDSSVFATMGSAVSEIAEQLRPHVCQDEECPPNMSDWRGRVPFVQAPWVDGVLDKEDLSEDPDDDVESPLLSLAHLVDQALDASDIGFEDDDR